MYGCERESSVAKDFWEIGPYKFGRCPLKVIDYRVYDWLRAYRRFEKGFFPEDGGWNDQSAKFNDVIDILEHEQATVAEKAKANTKC